MAEKKPTTKKKATSKKPTTKKEKKEVVETGAMEEFLNANVGKIAKVSKVEDIDGVPTVTIVPDNHLDSIECTLTVMPTELKGHPDPVGELGVDATKELENTLANELSEAFLDRNTIAEQVLALGESNKNVTELMEGHLTDIAAKEIDDKALQEHEELIEGKEEIKPSETIRMPIRYVNSHMGIKYDE